MGKILALDYGSVRIGAAISDEEHVFAFELEIFPRENFAEKYAQLLREHDVETTVLGYPISVGGGETETTAAALAFKSGLEDVAPSVPVELVDERFSSQFAQQHAQFFQKSGKTDKGKRGIDSLAAQVILQNYLERTKNIKK